MKKTEIIITTMILVSFFAILSATADEMTDDKLS